MTTLLDVASRILTWLFFIGLAGASLVIVLFLADLIRTIAQTEPNETRHQAISS